MPALGIGLGLPFIRRTGAITISGVAFPGETLTANRSGQWYANDLPIAGQTGKTYAVSVDDVGKDIRCGVSHALTVWHPSDVPQVKAAWVGSAMVYNDNINTPAANNDTVYRWTDIVGGFNAEQTSGASMPLYKDDGLRYVYFDGDNDYFEYNAASVFRNVPTLGCIAAVNDANPTGGDGLHGIMQTSISGQFAFTMQTRSGGGGRASGTIRFRGGGNIVDAVSTTAHSGWEVLDTAVSGDTGEAWLFRDGVQIAHINTVDTGRTQDSASVFRYIGWRDGLHFPGGMAAIIFYSGETLPSAVDMNRLRQYAGLLTGRNLGLPIV